MIFAIEGIDGSGKGTQARRLYQALSQAGHAARLVSFPRYSETLFGGAIGRFLNGEFGELADVHPLLASVLYAGDRFESRQLLETGEADAGIVVLDRYVASNIAHQAAKLDSVARTQLQEFIERLEHEVYGLPTADLTILLDLPVDQAQMLVARKQARDYTDRAADIQEADATYLGGVREAYRELAAADPEHWTIVECLSESGLRSIDEIGDQITQLVMSRLA